MSEQSDEPPTSPPDTTAQSKGAVEEDHDVTGDTLHSLQTLRQQLEVALEKVPLIWGEQPECHPSVSERRP